MMKSKICAVILMFLCLGCTNATKIKLDESMMEFDHFPSKDSLTFVAMSDEIMDEPEKMLLYGDLLIIKTFCKGKDNFLTIYSLEKNRIVNELIEYGNGPEEMLGCDIGLLDNRLWLYDISKMNIGFVPIDSLLLEHPFVNRCHLENYPYYRVAMLNDSIMLGTNGLENKSKISYVNIHTGTVTGYGNYHYLDKNTNLGALIDACSCYVDVNPKTKDIVLSYRYTDVVEFYTNSGQLKSALHGPECFDIIFRPNGASMAKTKDTRKAYVNSYVTEKNIYLLYSGCNRTEDNWANGTKIFVFSWDGKPQKQYVLTQPIYAFAVDEEKRVIYSYSLENGELVKAKM